MLKFRRWEAKRNGRLLVPVAVPVAAGEKIRLAEPPAPELPAGPIPKSKIGTVETQTYKMMDESALFDWARLQIPTDLKQFARRTGIEEIGWLDDLKPPPKSALFTEVGRLYFSKKRKITVPWERKQRKFWDEFCRVVHARTLREIAAADVDHHHDHVWKEAAENNRSPTFISHRFRAIKTILRHALKKDLDTQQVRRVLDICARFELPQKNGVNPSSIKRGDLHKLLAVCSPKWRVVVLLGLNAAMYPSEIAALRKDEIDLDAHELVTW